MSAPATTFPRGRLGPTLVGRLLVGWLAGDPFVPIDTLSSTACYDEIDSNDLPRMIGAEPSRIPSDLGRLVSQHCAWQAPMP